MRPNTTRDGEYKSCEFHAKDKVQITSPTWEGVGLEFTWNIKTNGRGGFGFHGK